MTVLVSDSFNRANNATTLGTTDSYNGGTPTTWQYRSGSVFGISNNTAITESGTNPVIAYVDVGQSDVKVNVTAVISNVNDYFMALFRYDPATNTGLILGGNPIKIQSFSGSTYTNIATTAINNAANDVFQIVLSGSSITVYRNGTQVVSGTSTINQTKTNHGLIDWRSINNGWDNFSVEDLNTGGTGTTYTGSGTIQGNENVNAFEKVIQTLNGVMQGLSSLTSIEHDILNLSGMSISNPSLLANENVIQQVMELVIGQAFVSSVEQILVVSAYHASGMSQGYSLIYSSDNLIKIPKIYQMHGLSNGCVVLYSNDDLLKINPFLVDKIVKVKGISQDYLIIKGKYENIKQVRGDVH